METLQEYKCPCCTAAVSFDSGIQKMKCPYCDAEFEMDSQAVFGEEWQVEANQDLAWEQTAGSQWADGEEEALQSYVCNSCGGEILADEHTAATACPYCGNPVVLTGRLSGSLKPDLVVPFQLDKAAAKAALKQHYSGKPLLPKIFQDENHLDAIKGVYVPFWLFDADVEAHIRYKATRVRRWTTSNYHYTETSYYALARGGSLGFSYVPVDGSSKLEDALMESIEPFDMTQAVDFNTAYLAGYLADKYDVTSEESIDRANQRIRVSTEAAFADTVHGYLSVLPESTNIRLANGRAKYALLPVWLLNTTWQGKTYTFAMNGQTGKLVGDLPMDKTAFWKWFGGIAGAVGAAVFAAAYLLWLL